MVADRGAIAGVHCCGNTDWGLVMDTSARIVNFDAVDYMESLAIYSEELKRFLGRGGVLAWGAVPNTPQAQDESGADVIRRITEGMKSLERSGLDRDLLGQRLLITPACGCAGLNESQAAEVYRLLSEVEQSTGPDAFRA
jgi:hypothetical protein